MIQLILLGLVTIITIMIMRMTVMMMIPPKISVLALSNKLNTVLVVRVLFIPYKIDDDDNNDGGDDHDDDDMMITMLTALVMMMIIMLT